MTIIHKNFQESGVFLKKVIIRKINSSYTIAKTQLNLK